MVSFVGSQRLRMLHLAFNLPVDQARYGHDYRYTCTQDQKPPEHPHSSLG